MLDSCWGMDDNSANDGAYMEFDADGFMFHNSATNRAPVAQLDRASASGAEGHRFESCRAYHLYHPCES